MAKNHKTRTAKSYKSEKENKRTEKRKTKRLDAIGKMAEHPRKKEKAGQNKPDRKTTTPNGR